MSGDNLAIALFLWSIAIGFILEGRREDGWKRWAFWGLAALAVASGFLWPRVGDYWPSGYSFVRAIAVSPVAWFVLFMSGVMLVAISGRLKTAQRPFQDQVATLRTGLEEQIASLNGQVEAIKKAPVIKPATAPVQTGPTRQWVSTRRAMLAFCDPQLYGKMNDALSACNANTDRQADLQAQYDAGARALSEGRIVSNQRALERDLTDVGKKVQPLIAQYQQALGICLYDLKGKLASGNLIARAFKCPYSGAEEPVMLSSAQWHALNFDMDDGDWQTVIADHTKYIGLQIAKA